MLAVVELSFPKVALLSSAIFGHVFFWATVVNRVHGQPWPCRTLQTWRNVIVGINVVVPLVLVGWAVVVGPLEQHPYLTATLMVFSTGLLIPIGAGLRELLHRPSVLADETSEVEDLKRQPTPPAGDGDLAKLAKLPGNELLRIDLTRKTLRLPRWPVDLPPLRVLHLTDWHFSGTPGFDFYDRATQRAKLTNPDLILFSGDLIDRMDLLPWIDKTLGRLTAPLGRFFILGNHDWMQDECRIRKAMIDAGWTDLASRTVTIEHEGQAIEIGGSEQPWMGREPWFTGEGLRFAVMHTPDRFGWAIEHDAARAVAGHNHGGQVRLPLVGPLLSPARTGTKYASGVFEKNGCVLHVGRGLGALHPLRFRCPPEISLLTLTAADSPPS